MFTNRILTYSQFVSMSKRRVVTLAKSLMFSEFGEPRDVLQLQERQVQAPKGKEVLVQILAAPINPSDINTIQGKYRIRPQLPAVAGNECVAKVIAVGDDVQTLKVDETVVPLYMGLGTWTTHALYNEDELLQIPKDVGLVEAATIMINPSTAYRMLKDFVHLLPGDTIIQNGANSAVGQSVHQLCKIWNINSVGVVRDRPEITELKQQLKKLGATEVLTEDELQKTTIFKQGVLKKPKVAFNCVGGKGATEIARYLDDSGILVTYGGMSLQPISVPVGQLVFQNLTFCGFNISDWVEKNCRSQKHQAMIDELCTLMACGKLVPPAYNFIELEKFKDAGAALSIKGFTGKKIVLKMV